MKKFILFIIGGLYLLIVPQLKASPVNDTVEMGASYANDVFYSMANGVVKTETRANWEIAFYTNRWSAGITINDGNGVMLYTYPLGDVSAWNSIDISNIDNWVNLVNSDTVWEDGAFNRNSLGHPDYGWGVYNTINHDVVGDSIYIVKLANGNLKKLFIERKSSVNNTFYFKYADIDGANEVNEVVDVTPFQDTRMFVYYSLMLQMVVDREPDINSWDLMFSRYSGIVFDNTGAPSNYVVVGITSNNEVGVAKHHPVTVDFSNWTSKPFEYFRTPIGHDWKEFNMSLFQWTIEDSLVYFVETLQGDIYKFYPEYFSGSGAGKTGFVKELISLVSVGELYNSAQALEVYPNPAINSISLKLNQEVGKTVEVHMFDLTGKLIYSQTHLQNNSGIHINIDLISNGMYVVETVSEGISLKSKFLINR